MLLTAATAAGQPPVSIVTGFKADQTVSPNTLVLASDGNFYGTTSFGGAFDWGTLYRVTPGGTVTVLHEFGASGDGKWPASVIQTTDGNLYGVTRQGGFGCGTIYKATLSGVVTNLYVVPLLVDRACAPNGLVQGPDGALYGPSGGTGTYGTIFRVSLDGDFSVGDFVNDPGNLIVASDGMLYGTLGPYPPYFSTLAAFKMTPGGTSPLASILTVFADLGLGGGPSGLIQVSNRLFFGTLSQGIYRMSTLGATAAVHRFTARNGDGSYPNADLVLAPDGNVYGTTYSGGDGSNPEYGDTSGHGTVFRITPDGTVSTVYIFTGGADGAYPGAGLTVGPDGMLYGTTNDGVNHGTIFRLTLDGHLTTLARAFTSGLSGSHPMAELVEGTDGFLYGTTSAGGPDNLGAVFKLSADGATTWLHYFKGTDGAVPLAGLLQAPDGAFYGTASAGGASGFGTIFRILPDGTFSVIHSFSRGDGAAPAAALVRAADGTFYGTTFGGPYDFGTVFRMTAAGDVTTLYNFTGGTDGSRPVTALLLAADGNLYGTTPSAGAYNAGTAFRLTTGGTFTLLHAFSGSDGTGRDGASPSGRLIQAADGNFYGTTLAGGRLGLGAVFRMSPGGSVSMMYSFAGYPDGAAPSGGLIQAPDGMFYGTTTAGGAGDGTIFQVSSSGTANALFSFSNRSYGGPLTGTAPRAALLLSRAGDIYGTTSDDGGPSSSGGYVFRLQMRPVTGRVTSNVRTGNAQLTWSSARATSYSVRRRTAGANDDVIIASGLTTTSFVDTTAVLQRGHAYVYTVTAFNAFGAIDLMSISVHLPVARNDDYDGDGKTDIAVFEPSNGMWFVINSSNQSGIGSKFGNRADIPVPGDYDGDGKTDIAIFRPSEATWYIAPSSRTGTVLTIPYGIAGDVPIPSDYDGDGVTDLAVFRPSNGTWYVWQSATNSPLIVTLGGDRLVVADYDGDGLTDIATFHPATGVWTIRLSTTGQISSAIFGNASDVPVPADFDGDGLADIAVYRADSRTWEVWQSATHSLSELLWSHPGDIPVVGDYDGDGLADAATFAPRYSTFPFNDGQWEVRLSSGGALFQQWGSRTAIPLPRRP